MLRLNRLPFLLLACCFYFSGIAQTTNCTADFNYLVTVDNAVNFIARDTIGIRHRWSFGDGTPVFISENSTVSHHYAQAGKYEVKHFVENPAANCILRTAYLKNGAGDEGRTRDFDLGKVALYH